MRTIVLWSALSVAALAATPQKKSLEFLSSYSSESRVVTVTGYAEHGGWLGISAYPKQGKTFSLVRFVQKGNVRETFSLPRSCEGAKYEVALWETRVPRTSCKTQCKWCQTNGFHMEGMRGYGTGTVGH